MVRSLLCCALLVSMVLVDGDGALAAPRHAPARPAPAAPQPPALPPLQAAIQRLIEHPDAPAGDRMDPARLRAMYGKRAYAPLWIEEDQPTAQATALLQALRTAEDHGLRASDYQPDALADLLKADDVPPVEREAAFEVRLSQTAGRFLVHLNKGRVDPKAASFELRNRPSLDYGALLPLMADGTEDVNAVITSVEPAFNHYQLLLGTLKQYRKLAEDPELTQLPPLKSSVKLGQAYAGVPALRKLLHAVGDLPVLEEPRGADTPKTASAKGGAKGRAARTAGKAKSKAVLDARLVQALKRFQMRHGLPPKGVLDRDTYAALTTPMALRVRQIELTLERWRWMPPFETPPIIVNIPQFKLFAFRSTQDLKEHILQMDVIVGQAFPEKQTPVFAADMRYLIFRPYWEIPRDILMNELLPKIRRNPKKYLAAEHLQIVKDGPGDDDLAPLPPTPDNIAALEAGNLRLRQEPGPDNSLGLIKFMFPNSHDVYLHSTPAHGLFKETRRDFSHGCIRVSDPAALAVQVLRDTPGDWTLEKVKAAFKAGDNQRVNLAKPIRVYILYASAMANEDGTVLFFNDIYGHDHELEALLQLPPVIPAPGIATPATARNR